MIVALTVKFIEALKPTPRRRLEYSDTVTPGLVLRVSEDGIKSWSVRYRIGGRLRRYTLGKYPSLKLAPARVAAAKALQLAKAGTDPAGVKRAAARGETIADLAKDYIARYAKPRKRSWREDDRMLEKDVLPHWRTIKVKDLTRRDVRERIDMIADRSASSARATLSVIRKMLNFAVSRDWVDANVASLIPKPGAARSRERVLGDEEIRQVWTAAAAEPATMKVLIRLRLITAQRGGELVKLKWTDRDGAWLTIPASVTKNKLAHRVPLTTLAAEAIAELPKDSSEWMFAGRQETRHLWDAKKAGRRVADRVLVSLQKDDPKIEAFDFRGHDLRRTAATRMAAAGIPNADIAKVLNHVEGGPRATQVYNRYAYDKEKQIALETWERTLTAILADEQPSGQVIPFAR